MPKKKPDPAPAQPSVPSLETSSLSFTIETFDDPETGKPTQYGRFSRHWQDEEALDVLIDKLEGGQLGHKQALMQARKLEVTTPSLPTGCECWAYKMKPPRCMNRPTSRHWPTSLKASKAKSLEVRWTTGPFCAWRTAPCWA